MNIDSSNRKIMTAGLVLLVVAGGLGIYMVADSFNSELPLPSQAELVLFLLKLLKAN